LVEGWLFDAYLLREKIVFWIKQDNGDTIRLEDSRWSHSIYVASDDKSNLKSIVNRIMDSDAACLVKDYEFTSRYETIIDKAKSEVLKLTLSDSAKASALARRIETINGNNIFGRVRLYNVDLLPEQSYFYGHDIFPLAFCEVHDNNHLQLRWDNKDDVWASDYKIPGFKIIHLDLNLKKKGKKIPKYTDKIDTISITQQEGKGHECFEIQSPSEDNMIEQLAIEIKRIDPDFIFTNDGDSFTFPCLIYRAETNGMSNNLILGREPAISLKRSAKEGTSYFSYGRTYFKPSAIKLFGRIHIDTDNSFILNDAGLEGLYEISRICRMPLHTAARASIGKCLSSLQFYYATQKEILVPWKPILAEYFKTFEELLLADRGGFIFEPETETHEQVAEFDFVSLYPNIMLKKNLSAETIHCNCCPDSKLRVRELNHNICERRVGIVPTSLKILLEKRAIYKHLKKSTTNQKLKAVYDARQTSLKWILVTSFGYLGFNNAKFGRIDAHIAVCAFDRQIVLQVAKIAERHGFKVLHGIVDSLWIKKNSNIDKSIEKR
jgi:DNA polymerase-2